MDELRNEMAAAHAAQEQAMALPRLQQEVCLQRGNHQKTMCLLRAIKSGAVKVEQVVIDGDNWSVLDPTQVPVVLPGEAVSC